MESSTKKRINKWECAREIYRAWRRVQAKISIGSEAWGVPVLPSSTKTKRLSQFSQQLLFRLSRPCEEKGATHGLKAYIFLVFYTPWKCSFTVEQSKTRFNSTHPCHPWSTRVEIVRSFTISLTLPLTSLSAPDSRRNFTISARPFIEALMRAVLPHYIYTVH